MDFKIQSSLNTSKCQNFKDVTTLLEIRQTQVFCHINQKQKHFYQICKRTWFNQFHVSQK